MGKNYYLGTVTQKNKNHKETWCYHTDNTVKVFNLAQSLYDGEYLGIIWIWLIPTD